MTTAEKLCRIRAKHKVTNQQIADMTGIPIGTISGMMSGQITSPNFNAVCTILETFNEDIPSFYRGDETSAPQPKPQVDHIELLDRVQAKAENIATEAITRAMTGTLVERSEKRERRSMMLNVFFIVLIVFVLVWDITHPDMGYVRY